MDPSGALTFPATVFFLVCLAWPALLAAKSNPVSAPLFWPTQWQSIVFFVLTIAGAPVSAWAAFVIGSNRGRSRRRAGLVGLSVAALFFLPAWAWAGLRYAQLKRAPFKIESVAMGTGGNYAFVNLVRHPTQDPLSRTDNNLHYSALLVDITNREWRLAGKLDRSAFVPEHAYQRSKALLDSDCPRFFLVDRSVNGEPVQGWDGLTARVSENCEPTRTPAYGPYPADFGVLKPPAGYRVHWAGLGHELRFRDDDRDIVQIFRDPLSGLVLDSAEIQSELNWISVRIRKDRWLCSHHGGLTWVDPSSGETTETGCDTSGLLLGPSITDGRVVLIGRDGLVCWTLRAANARRFACFPMTRCPLQA